MSDMIGKPWVMTDKTFGFITHILPDGKTVLELGSGYSTENLSKHYTMYSIEHNKKWIGKGNSTYIYASVIEYKDGEAPDVPGLEKLDHKIQIGWYDPEVVKNGLQGIKYDLIFIDGPTGRVGRAGFFKYIDLFNASVPIVIDDVVRIGEFILMKKIANYINQSYYVIPDSTKVKNDQIHYFGCINVDPSCFADFTEYYENPDSLKDCE